MNLKRLKLFALLLLAFGLIEVQAQESVNATGSNASGSGGSASYSVGQVVFTSHTGSNGSVAEGVQQAYEIAVVSGIEEASGIKLFLTAYPNPTTDYLTLNIDASPILNIQAMTYQLYDMSGRLLQTEEITSRQTKIGMSQLISATYFVKVLKNNKDLQTFKIIKK